MRRRNLLALLAGAACWPLTTARAQERGTPVIGFLSSVSPPAAAQLVTAFHRGLNEQGYVEGRNLSVHYRWAEGRYHELDALAADLVRRKVLVIAATGGVVSVQAAKKATADIPTLFISGFDPVQLGLVSSINRPGGNLTGVSIFTTELAIKRLELLYEILSDVDRIAILVNPGSVATNIEIKESITAAQHFGLEFSVLEATDESSLETAFDSAVRKRTSALLVSADPFFTSRRDQIVGLAARHALPTMYPFRAYIEAGGLVSYGTKLTWAYHQIGVYAGRILKGAKPADLPVVQPTRFDLVINLKAAKALGIVVSPWLLARADETIE